LYREYTGIFVLPLLGLLGLLPTPAVAHHNFATHYDETNIVEINGTLTSVELRNPHSFFTLDVLGSKGLVENWEVEGHAVGILRREGVTDNTFSIGDVVTVSGPRGRRKDKNLVFGANLQAADGSVFHTMKALTRGSKDKISDTRRGVRGLDRFAGRYLGTSSGGQRIADTPMHLTEAGAEARANFNVHDTPGMNCVAPNLPSIFYPPYLFDIRIDSDQVVLHHEYYGVERPLVIGEPAQATSNSEYGHRSGRYEDNTLIVDSSGFPEMLAGLAGNLDSNGNGADIPSSEQKRIAERYSLSADGSELSISYTVEDSVYLAEPYTDTLVYYRVSPKTPFYDFPCDKDISLRSTLNAQLPD
jgi:hypothetical protein